jgi:hypothetical protein
LCLEYQRLSLCYLRTVLALLYLLTHLDVIHHVLSVEFDLRDLPVALVDLGLQGCQLLLDFLLSNLVVVSHVLGVSFKG